jgi:hypothetical protein
MPRETREQRLARRRAQAEQRQAEEAAELARALQRQIAVEHISRLERAVTGSELFQDVCTIFYCFYRFVGTNYGN